MDFHFIRLHVCMYACICICICMILYQYSSSHPDSYDICHSCIPPCENICPNTHLHSYIPKPKWTKVVEIEMQMAVPVCSTYVRTYICTYIQFILSGHCLCCASSPSLNTLHIIFLKIYFSLSSLFAAAEGCMYVHMHFASYIFNAKIKHKWEFL